MMMLELLGLVRIILFSSFMFLTDCSMCAGRERVRAPGSAMAQVAGWFPLLSSTLGVLPGFLCA